MAVLDNEMIINGCTRKAISNVWSDKRWIQKMYPCLFLATVVRACHFNFEYSCTTFYVYLYSHWNSGNSIRLPCTYAPYAKFFFFWVSKNSNEKFHMYIFIIHMRSSKFREKMTLHVIGIKKIKHVP
jgi:hypothetical protein